jgi:hypothetical protein
MIFADAQFANCASPHLQNFTQFPPEENEWANLPFAFDDSDKFCAHSDNRLSAVTGNPDDNCNDKVANRFAILILIFIIKFLNRRQQKQDFYIALVR